MTLLLKATEAEFQDLVIDYARTVGWLVHHCRPARSGRGGWHTPIQGDPGFPDLVLVRAGRIVVAELKSETGRISTDQHAWLKALDPDPDVVRCESAVYLWRPSDWPEIQEALR